MVRIGSASGVIALVLAAAACNLINGVGDLSVADGTLAAPDRDGAIGDDAGAGGDSANGTDGGSTAIDGAASSNQLVFLAGTEPPNSGGLAAYPAIVALSGGAPRAIGCATEGAATAFEPSPPVGGASAQNGPYLVGHLSSRAYGSTFLYLDTPSNGGSGAALLAANDTTDCASNPPKRIDRGLQGQEVVPGFPRFSPSGARVAYIEQQADRANRIVTVSAGGPSGGAANVIRESTDVDAGNGAALWIAPPAWLAEDEVAWVESASGPTYLPQTIRRAKDSASPVVQTISTCNRYIEQLEIFSRNGAQHVALVSSAQSWTQQNDDASTTLSVHTLGQSCTTGKTLVPDTSKGSIARDAAVSPDGAFIAFASNVDSPPASRSLTSPLNVYVVDSLGNAPPVRCSDADIAADEYAPQWLANGTKLVWARTSRGGDQRAAIWVADVANGVCTNQRAILDDPDGGTRYVTQANAGVACGVSLIGARGRWSGASPFLPAPFLAAIGVVLVVARRRRRDRACS